MMRVRIVRSCDWQDAGAERPLRVGQAYVLPELVALSLVATGAAEAEDQDVATPVPAPLKGRRR